MEIFDNDSFITNPQVSVAVITYNHEKYIGECLDNIINQSVDFPIEIIVADDASTDRTREICITYQKKYPKIIKLIFNKKNLGLVKNYLNVLSHCRGRYIAQIAGDDYWCDVNKLSTQKSYLDDNKEIGLVYTNTYRLYKRVFQKDFISYDVKSFWDHLMHPGYLAPNTWMYRSEYSPLKFLGDENAHYIDESYAYLLDMFKVSKIAFIPQYMAVYRAHPGSLSFYNSYQQNYVFRKGIFEIKKDYIRKYDITDENIIHEIYKNGYLQLMEGAMILEDKQLLDEMKIYINSHKLIFEDIEILVKQTIKCREEFCNIKKSKSYKVGKFFIKPLTLLKNLIRKHVK